MALSTTLPSLLILILLTTTTTTTTSSQSKETHIHFYFHELYNITSFIVASLNNPSSAFGNFRVYDNALREGPEPNSKLIGRGQGIAVSASLDDGAILTSSNFVFTEGNYKGSTLSLFGRVDATSHAERTVIGGSGQFRLATGYAVSRPLPTSTDSYLIIEFNFYVTLKVDHDIGI